MKAKCIIFAYFIKARTKNLYSLANTESLPIKSFLYKSLYFSDESKMHKSSHISQKPGPKICILYYRRSGKSHNDIFYCLCHDHKLQRLISSFTQIGRTDWKKSYTLNGLDGQKQIRIHQRTLKDRTSPLDGNHFIGKTASLHDRTESRNASCGPRTGR
jgi:hypothetical protein